jgi:RsmE family RNA methyltransferase
LWSLWKALPDCTKMMLVIGPEGGFAPEEAVKLGDSGFQSVHLGPRTMRFETAATVLVATAQLLWGDLARQLASPVQNPKNI